MGAGQRSSLDDLPAVANGTTENHTEDHPNDLLKRTETILSETITCVPVCFHPLPDPHSP